MNRSWVIIIVVAVCAWILVSCSEDEKNLETGPSSDQLMLTSFPKPKEIEVDAAGRRALLLHDRLSPSGPALQLVDLAEHRVVSTLILDYYDVSDVAFVNDTSAVFAGRPQGNIGYAVQFFSLDVIVLTTRVMVTDTQGTAGSLAVDTANGFVYYSHAGGTERDAVYKINAETRTVVDADNDEDLISDAMDNDLVEGLFSGPSRIFYDYETDKVIVGNSDGEFVTMIDANLWGTLHRLDNLVFPVGGMSQLSTASGEVSNVHMMAAATGDGVYAFAGTNGSVSYLSRFRVESIGLDFVETFADREWSFADRGVAIHPRADIFSMFVVQEDSVETTIGQFRLNNLAEVAGSPYEVQFISDSMICAIAMDTLEDELIVADTETGRLEFIDVGP